MKLTKAISLLPVALLAGVAALLTACNKTPDNVLPAEDMARMLADLHTAEAYADANSSKFSSDSAKRVLKQSVYATYGLSVDEAEESFRWYGYNMDKYVEVYDRSLEILNERLEDAESKTGSSSKTDLNASLALEGDSVDIWNAYRTRRFSLSSPSEYIPVTISSDPNWERGDVYTLKARLHSNQSNANVNLAIEYTNGDIEYFSQQLMGDGWHEIKFALDSARAGREIYGTISYSAIPGQASFIDSLTLVRTRWNPKSSPALRENLRELHRKAYRRSYH